MRVLFVTTHFYLPQAAGGSESSMHGRILMLKQHKHEAAVLSSLKANDCIWFRNRVISKLTNKTFPSDACMGYRVYRGWSFDQKAVSEVCDDFKPDIAVIRLSSSSAPLIEYFLNIGVPVLIHIVTARMPRVFKSLRLCSGESMPPR